MRVQSPSPLRYHTGKTSRVSNKGAVIAPLMKKPPRAPPANVLNLRKLKK